MTMTVNWDIKPQNQTIQNKKNAISSYSKDQIASSRPNINIDPFKHSVKANSTDGDQTPHIATSDLNLHYTVYCCVKI